MCEINISEVMIVITKISKIAICTILCLCFLVSVSCSSASVTLLPFLETGNSDEDLSFGGYEFIIKNAPNPADPTYPSSVTGDAILARYKEVEKQYDIKIVIEEEEPGDYISNLNLSSASGNKNSDLNRPFKR